MACLIQDLDRLQSEKRVSHLPDHPAYGNSPRSYQGGHGCRNSRERPRLKYALEQRGRSGKTADAAVDSCCCVWDLPTLPQSDCRPGASKNKTRIKLKDIGLASPSCCFLRFTLHLDDITTAHA
ncbi:hypothetical protein PV05_09525 [Exophiala xenobiotica]|uniref:Uncharacterized protein n=1 Tax=Exophiala xenobiotica TaxID=348802 RepID=A0A0D2CLI9_9EURO|nr:uncharacterized protein PV05_09525 [Exophiala xenobiotica]KIW50737.1 hypothetical protein PV05_09525 [Exophiala xenobiotica]